MEKKSFRNYTIRTLILFAIALPMAAVLYLLKRQISVPAETTVQNITITAKPITTLPEEHATDTVQSRLMPIESDTLVRDHRPPTEAGEEDGYWDGWADGSEARSKKQSGHKARKMFDPSSRYATAAERDTYAGAYRVAYEEGFAEAFKAI